MLGPEQRDQRSARDGPHRRRDADDRALEAERAAPFRPLEELLDEPDHLGVEEAARDALDDPGDDEPGRGGREPGGRAREGEEPEAEDEDRLATSDVAEPTRGNEDEPEREGVAGDDPLQLALRAAEPGANGGQGDVDDADVEERHEGRDKTHRERLPAVPVLLGRHGRSSGGVTPVLIPGPLAGKPADRILGASGVGAGPAQKRVRTSATAAA